jgi:hypothetical protein
MSPWRPPLLVMVALGVGAFVFVAAGVSLYLYMRSP